MPYVQNNLISRASYSSMSGWTDDLWDGISGAAGGVLKFYGQQQQAVGAAQAAQQQSKDLMEALKARTGIGVTEMLLIGGAVTVGAVLLLRRKSQ